MMVDYRVGKGLCAALAVALVSGAVCAGGFNFGMAGAVKNKTQEVEKEATKKKEEAEKTTGPILYTIAGSGNGGAYAGDGGLATAAKLFGPNDVAIDSLGNVFIADSINYRVRRVDAVTGIITTFAGTGVAGYNGDGIAANTAQVSPQGLGLDSSGNLYIAEIDRIRKVDHVTSIISTVAGGGTLFAEGVLATAASVGGFDIDFDSFGNMLIAGASRVMKVDAMSGIISTVAGGGSIFVDGFPATSVSISAVAIAVDKADNIFIADYYGHRVSKVNATTGTISTVAGTGIDGYNGDDILATSAYMSYPYGVAIDNLGNLYVSQWKLRYVRKIDANTGIIDIIAGGGTQMGVDNIPALDVILDAPRGLLVYSGNLYIAARAGHRVYKLAL